MLALYDVGLWLKSTVINKVELYTDGSYFKDTDPNTVHGGFIVLMDGVAVQAVHVSSNNASLVSGWNAGGELLAASCAFSMTFGLLDQLKELGITVPSEIHIYHDYNGVANFMVPPQGKSKPWKASKPASSWYVTTMNKLEPKNKYDVKYHWIKGHSGDKWNAAADLVASGKQLPSGWVLGYEDMKL